MSLIRNERTKLTATFLNGLAIAIFAVGGLTQSIRAFNEPTTVTLGTVVLGVVCLLGAFALHMTGRWILGRLEQ